MNYKQNQMQLQKAHLHVCVSATMLPFFNAAILAFLHLNYNSKNNIALFKVIQVDFHIFSFVLLLLFAIREDHDLPGL